MAVHMESHAESDASGVPPGSALPLPIVGADLDEDVGDDDEGRFSRQNDDEWPYPLGGASRGIP